MKIESIFYHNLDMLYSGVSTEPGVFEKHFGSVYRKASVNFVITEVTLVEAMMLKEYATTATLFYNDSITMLNDHDDEKLYNIIKDIELMGETPDVTEKPGITLLSADMVEVKVLAEFSGLELTSIITSYPDIFFSHIFAGSHNDSDDGHTKDEKPLTELPNDEESVEKIKNALVEAFLNGFYRYIATSFKQIDFCADIVNKTLYHDKIKETEHVRLIEFSSPTGMVNMFTDRTHAAENLSSLKKFNSDVALTRTNPDLVNEHIKLTLVIRSSFATFCYIKSALPKGYITDHTDFNALLSNYSSVTFGGIDMDKYGNVIDNDQSYLEERLHTLSEGGNSIRHYFAIPLYRPIVYTLQISLNEINYEFSPYIKALMDIMDSNSYVYRDLQSIVSGVASNAQMVYNAFSK